MLQMISITISAILFAITSAKSVLESRKTLDTSLQDPYIVCHLRGPDHMEGLPPIFDVGAYDEMLAMCSAAHGRRENLGCYCENEGADVVCDEDKADSRLWDSTFVPLDVDITQFLIDNDYPTGTLSFAEFCELGCICLNPRVSEYFYVSNGAGARRAASRGRTALVDGQRNSTSNTPSPPPDQGLERSGNFAAGSFNVAGAQSQSQSQSRPPQQNGQSTPQHHRMRHECARTCTSINDCNTFHLPPDQVDKATCTCQAKATAQYQPGAGDLLFTAACALIANNLPGNKIGGHGRRDGDHRAEHPCPCNATYVSHACCSAEAGIVWEEPQFKLGKLLIDS